MKNEFYWGFKKFSTSGRTNINAKEKVFWFEKFIISKYERFFFPKSQPKGRLKLQGFVAQ